MKEMCFKSGMKGQGPRESQMVRAKVVTMMRMTLNCLKFEFSEKIMYYAISCTILASDCLIYCMYAYFCYVFFANKRIHKLSATFC